MNRKLRFYLRGLGIGIVVTALLMTIVNGRKQPELTDDQIRARAVALGMVDAGNLTLTERIGSEGAEGGTESTDSAAGETAEGTSEGTAEEGDSTGKAAAGASVALNEDGAEIGEAAGTDDAGETGENPAAGAGDAAETGENPAGETGENPADQPAEGDQPAETQQPAETEDPVEAEEPVETEEPAETEVPVEEPQQETPQPEPPAQTGSTATITVRSGYGSERIAQLCKDAGLVESAADFDDFLVKNGYSTSLRVGTFHIPMGSNYTEIAKILSGRN